MQETYYLILHIEYNIAYYPIMFLAYAQLAILGEYRINLI